jgi:hypothetical protein
VGNKVYLAVVEKGEYESYRLWIEAAFSNRAEADRFVELRREASEQNETDCKYGVIEKIIDEFSGCVSVSIWFASYNRREGCQVWHSAETRPPGDVVARVYYRTSKEMADVHGHFVLIVLAGTRQEAMDFLHCQPGVPADVESEVSIE